MKAIIKFMSLFTMAIGILSGCTKEPMTEAWELSWESKETSFGTDIGGKVLVTANVNSSVGLNTVTVKLPEWSTESPAAEEVIEVPGSPKQYELKYEIVVPENAAAGEKTVTFVLTDNDSKTTSQEVTVIVRSDEVKPELVVTSPEKDVIVAPNAPLEFNVKATDNLKMKEVIIKCEELKINKTFEPESEQTEVNVNWTLESVGDKTGSYVITVTAVDNQLNETQEKINLKVLLSSKPRVTPVFSQKINGVAGGYIPFRFKLESNELHPLTKIVVKSQALGIDKTITPEAGAWSIDFKLDIELPANTPKQNNVSYTVAVTNDIDETTEYKSELNVITEVFLIGRATMAFEKEGKALRMQQNPENKNEFEYITWVNVKDTGVKFLSTTSWNEFNWGLNDEGKIYSDGQSAFILIKDTGYHKITFNAATLEYKIEKLEINEAPKAEKFYIKGFFYVWNGNEWVENNNWDTPVEMKKHPENPHSFYIDIKTGPEGSNVAVWKIFGQESSEGNGIFYGINAEPDQENGSKWLYNWWEYAGKLYCYETFQGSSYFREDGRKNAVMRLWIDTKFDMISWMPLKEQSDAKWEIYPALYTPVE